MGLVCTYIVHIIPEFAEEHCTATLYMHGWSHTWFKPRTPMLFSDEAGERDPNTGSIGIMPPTEGEDNAASFQGPGLLAREQRVQLA